MRAQAHNSPTAQRINMDFFIGVQFSKELGSLQEYDLDASVHLAMFIRVIGHNRVAFSASADLDAFRRYTTFYHRAFHLLSTSFRENLVRAIGTDVIGMSDNADALAWTGYQIFVQLAKCRFGSL